MDKLTIARVAGRRIQGIIRERVYISTKVDLTRPETIRACVNQRCNYACQYCYSWQRPEYPEISIEQWKHALLSLRDYIGKYVVQFSGGEPFIKKGFIDLLAFCHRSGIEWGVISNGSALSQKMVERLVAANPVNIDLSVDSSNAAINDEVRGFEGGLDEMEAGIKRLVAERLKRNSKFVLRIKPTVTKKSFRHLPALVVWAATHGATSIDFSPVRPEQFWLKRHYDDLWLTEPEIEELEQIVQELLRLKSSGARVETSAEKLLSFADHFRGRKAYPGLSPCRVGMRDYLISPTGDVQVCWEYPSIGNVTRESAKEIWEGAKAREIRAQTLTCEKFATTVCANSCLTHRTLRQETTRLARILRTE